MNPWTRFLNMTRKALKQYLADNNNMLPADLLPLKPYYDPAVTDDMLQRYAFMQTGTISANRSDSVVRKAVYADPDYDFNQEMSLSGGGGGSWNHFRDAIYNATMDYVPGQQRANAGRSFPNCGLSQAAGGRGHVAKVFWGSDGGHRRQSAVAAVPGQDHHATGAQRGMPPPTTDSSPGARRICCRSSPRRPSRRRFKGCNRANPVRSEPGGGKGKTFNAKGDLF